MNDDIEHSVKKALKRWDDPLPPNIEGRLRAARRTALEAPASRGMPHLLTAGLALGLVAAVTVGVLMYQQPGFDGPQAEDMLMLTTGDEFELYDEIEFMIWLGEAEEAEFG